MTYLQQLFCNVNSDWALCLNVRLYYHISPSSLKTVATNENRTYRLKYQHYEMVNPILSFSFFARNGIK